VFQEGFFLTASHPCAPDKGIHLMKIFRQRIRIKERVRLEYKAFGGR